METLETRLAPATFGAVGVQLNLDLNTVNEAVAIVSGGTSYTLTLTGGTWTGIDTVNVIGNGTSTLTVTTAGLAAFDTVNLTDSATGTRATFGDSGASLYGDTFAVTLDDAAGQITFNGTSAFTGSAGLSVRTSRNITFASGSSLTTASGNIVLEANLQEMATTGGFHGVSIDGARIDSGNGSLRIDARGGSAGLVTGVRVTNSGVLTSGGGNVSVTGTGNSTASVSAGLWLDLGGEISAGNTGTVTVVGRASLVSTGNNLIGVIVDGGGSRITSAGGNVDVTGTGGNSTSSNGCDGVRVSNGGQISAGGTGTVTVLGQGGLTPTSLNTGVVVSGAGSEISSAGGNVRVTGTGGGASTSGGNFGIWVVNSARVAAGGQGTVTLVGNGSTTNSGGGNDGLRIEQGTAVVTSAGGDIQLTGTPGNGASVGIRVINNGSVVSVGTASIALIADKIDFFSGTIDGLTNTVSLRPQTDGRAINLGSSGDTTASTLELSDSELDRITAGTIVIGSTATGAITVSASISPANAATLHLVTGANVIDGNGTTANSASTNNITVTSLAVSAATGIDLDINVTNLAATNDTSGAVDFNDVLSGTPLTIGQVHGVTGISNPGGTVSVLNNQATLTITANVSANGDVLLRGTDTTGSGHDLTIAAGKSIVSTNGSIDVRGGDIVTFEAGVVLDAFGSVIAGVRAFEGFGQFLFGSASILAGTTAEIFTESTTTLGTVTAGGTVVIHGNNGGGVTDGNGAAVNVTAPALAISSSGPSNVGLGDAIETRVANLEVRHDANGFVVIANDTAALELGGVTVPAGHGTFSGVRVVYGVVTITNTGTLNVTTSGDTVVVGNDTNTSLSLSGSAITIGTSITGTGGVSVSLTATNGAITSTNGSALDVITTSGVARLIATTGIGTAGSPLDLSVANLESNTTSANGNQFLTEFDSLTVANNDLTAGNGTINLNGGTFLTKNGGDIGSNVVVGTGATLGGVGRVTGNVTGSGTVSPGNSPGILEVVGMYGPVGTLVVEINGTTPGTQHDQVKVTGPVNLTGTTLSASGTISTNVGQVIVLIDNDDAGDFVTGTFDDLPEGAVVTINELPFQISYAGGAGENDVVLTQVPFNVFLDAGDNLVFTDLDGSIEDDLSITFDGTNYTLNNTGQVLITMIAGATGSGTHTVVVPASAVLGSGIIVNGMGGNDTLGVTYGASNFVDTLTFNGGDDDDTLQTSGTATGALALTMNGDAGTDTVNLGGAITFASNESLLVGAESVTVGVNATSSTSGSGVVTLTADDVAIDPTASLGSAATVTIRPQTANRPINLGSQPSGSLGLTDTELDRITAGTLVIGDVTSGTLTVSADITRPASTMVDLISGGNVVQDGGAGSFDTGGGTLRITHGPSGSYQPRRSGTDVAASTLRFASGSILTINVSGTTVDAQYTQLKVAGIVDLSGVDLILTGAFVPSTGNVFTFVSATSVTGSFRNLEDGSTIVFEDRTMRIDYTDTTVTGTILDDDVFVNVSPVAVAENGGTGLVYTFTRRGVTDDALVVNFTVAGTALLGGDYSASGATTFTQTSGSVTIESGSSTATVTLNPEGDDVVEPNETIRLALSPGGRYVVGSPATAEGTITDDDTLTVEFDRETSSDGEDVGGNLPRLVVSGEVQDGHSVTIDVAVTGGTAGSGEFTTPTTLTVPAGSYAGTTFAIPSLGVVDDEVVEPDETIVLGDITGSAVSVGTRGSSSYTIEDDDTATVSIAWVNDGAEAGSTTDGKFRVTLSKVSSTDTAIRYLLGGSATAGSDFAPTSLMVVVPAGQTQADILVDVLQDSAVEGREAVSVTLDTFASADDDIGIATGSASLDILDDDTARVFFALATSSVSEGTPKHVVGVTLVITANGIVGTGTLERKVSVEVRNLPGGSAGIADHLFSSPATIEFLSGESGSTRFATLDIVNDRLRENNETIRLQLENLVGGAGGQVALSGPASHTATIVDDDSRPVARGNAYSMVANRTLVVSARLGVLANDTAMNGQRMQAILVRGPAVGLLRLNRDGSFTYVPRRGFTGRVTFVYRAFNGIAFSDPVVVTIDVLMPGRRVR